LKQELFFLLGFFSAFRCCNKRTW